MIKKDYNAIIKLTMIRIKHMKQGLLYPCDKVKSLEEAVIWSLENEKCMNQMRIESRNEFIKYLPETVLKVILDEFSESEQK